MYCSCWSLSFWICCQPLIIDRDRFNSLATWLGLFFRNDNKDERGYEAGCFGFNLRFVVRTIWYLLASVKSRSQYASSGSSLMLSMIDANSFEAVSILLQVVVWLCSRGDRYRTNALVQVFLIEDRGDDECRDAAWSCLCSLVWSCATNDPRWLGLSPPAVYHWWTGSVSSKWCCSSAMIDDFVITINRTASVTAIRNIGRAFAIFARHTINDGDT